MATDSLNTAELEGTSQQPVSPDMLITKGKTFLAVHDYYNAVGSLADGCRMFSDKYSETGDELAEPYLLYGRALLGLAREEQVVLGTGLPGIQDPGDQEDDNNADEESVVASAELNEEAETGGQRHSKSAVATDKVEPGVERNEEQVVINSEKGDTKEIPNGEASTSTLVQQNGKTHGNGDVQEEEEEEEDDEEEEEAQAEAKDIDDNEDDDGSSNLQIAWEVLELSKMIVQKREDSAEKTQFLAETHRLLGEVALESGNHAGAIGDLSTCLELMRGLDKVSSRQFAEVHYQLGLAHSLGNGYNKSISHFEEALQHLDERINYLKSPKEVQQDVDSKYDPEEEIEEIQELIPEIKEKIDDMKDMKQQTCKVLLESIKGHIGEGNCSNGAGPSGASTSSATGSSTSSSSVTVDAKPASDINHLIRKKRKNEEDETEGSPRKKPNDILPSKSV